MMQENSQDDFCERPMKLDITSAEFAELMKRCYMNFAETGRLCGVAPSTARRWAKTTKPAHYAVAILKLTAAKRLDVMMYRALKAAYNDPSRVSELLSRTAPDIP